MMQATQVPWRTPWLNSGRPTLGDLMSLCEENYSALMRLIPDLRRIQGEERSVLDSDQDLYLEVLEQAPYTTLLRLTYYFPHDDGLVHRVRDPDPDALLRAYHDAAQVEVLNLRQTILPLRSHYSYPALEAKWKINLFLAKWLGYCLTQGYRFSPNRKASAPLRVKAPVAILP
jgi:uncharacterized protein YqiB (DUF1249 family)